MKYYHVMHPGQNMVLASFDNEEDAKDLIENLKEHLWFLEIVNTLPANHNLPLGSVDLIVRPFTHYVLVSALKGETPDCYDVMFRPINFVNPLFDYVEEWDFLNLEQANSLVRVLEATYQGIQVEWSWA